MTFTKMKNNKGSRLEPCGILEFAVKLLDMFTLNLMTNFPDLKQVMMKIVLTIEHDDPM